MARYRHPGQDHPSRSEGKRRPLEVRIYLLTFSLALLVYLLTLAPDLTWANYGGDGGELITAAVTLGVPHPPGYPTYVLLGKLLTFLPLGTIAYRFNLFSAVTTALACAFLTAIASDERGYRQAQRAGAVSYVAAGLLLAFNPLVWSQAVIAEVYSLNLAFVAAFLWALLTRRPPWLTGLLLGLSLTTHLTSALLLPLGLAFIPGRRRHAFALRPRSTPSPFAQRAVFGSGARGHAAEDGTRGEARRRNWFRLAIGFLLGLSPFLAIPWLAQGDSPVVWGEPVTLSGWWWLVSGRLYHDNVLALPAAALLARLGQWSLAFMLQYGWFALPLLALGYWSHWRSHRPREALILITAVLYGLYALTYRTDDASVYVIPGLFLLCLLLIPGLQRLRWAALLLPLALLAINYSEQNLRWERSVRPLAEQLLQEAPPAAILLTPGDQTIFSLWYFQHVEGLRPDLILVDANLFAFDWYRQRLQRLYPSLQGLNRDDLETFRQKNRRHRPLCAVTLLNTDTNRCTLAVAGFRTVSPR